MTDKAQIIIDSVDVSKCEHYNICKQCELSQLPESFYKLRCSENLDCNFKQLARKTQECEELKKQLMQKSEVDMFFNTPIEGWSNDPCGICPHKAENEKLKESLKVWQYSDVQHIFEIKKYEQTLTEIKKIAEPFCNACQEFEPEKRGRNCMYCNYGKILQKISECEVNND